MRNPAIAAMEIATLCALHPGRVEVAFGHGVEAWMRQIGARPPDRLVALEEVVRATRALLRGETVTTDGSFVRLRDVRLEHPPDSPAGVLVGTTGERGIAIAGRAADGLVVPEGSSEAALRWAKDRLGDGTLVAYTWLRIGETPVMSCRRSYRRGATAASIPGCSSAPVSSRGSRSPARPRVRRGGERRARAGAARGRADARRSRPGRPDRALRRRRAAAARRGNVGWR